MDNKYQTDMIEFLRHIKCDALNTNDDEVEEDEEDSIEEESHEEDSFEKDSQHDQSDEEESDNEEDDNNNDNDTEEQNLHNEGVNVATHPPDYIVLGPARKKMKLCNRDDLVSAQTQEKVIKTYRTTFKPKNPN